MALTNRDRVSKALELLRDGLIPFVEREMKAQHAQQWLEQIQSSVSDSQTRLFEKPEAVQWDLAALLLVMWNQWQLVFRKQLGQSERTLVSELRDVRNRWAHQQPFSSDDAERALDSAARLLTSIAAPQVGEIQRMRQELRRLVFDELVRSEKRRSAGSLLDVESGHLKPWREVITPHADVASGNYQQAEFAADLFQVAFGQGSAPEYSDPAEFFRRTYLTESLRGLLKTAILRLGGQGGDPVVQLQTNFGGGKTHSMLALYHMVSGAEPGQLLGLEPLLQEMSQTTLPTAHRVVLVGNKLSANNPRTTSDGTRLHTLWGELAWQLGGREAYDLIRLDDEKATNPGDRVRELLVRYGPSLVLIDEWVAYARQLHDLPDLAGGTFDTQFTFAQTLTEAAKDAGNCLLVISLPASDTSGSPHTLADEVEVGGLRGREALDRLRNVVGRLESSWRPASAEEGFEIVRRRLFEPIQEQERFTQRDLTARSFADYYRTQAQDFPPECREASYEQRIKAAFPIHPEVFDRLYNDWSTLLKFQRTRGVLRMMAAVIHSLWEKGDQSPLILPASLPIDDARVQPELTRYLSDGWVPIIARDVDGPDATPRKIDSQVPALGRMSACRRVARTIYMGSAPSVGTRNQGIDERHIRLGSALPGDSTSVFGDALRRLAQTSTFLYQDGSRYWYSTTATVAKLATDRADVLLRSEEALHQEIGERIRTDVKRRGEFARVHALPIGGQEVPDLAGAALVVLGPATPHTKDGDSPALKAARSIFETCGSHPRTLRNSPVFLAADSARLQELNEAVSRYLAWRSVVADKDSLNLTLHQAKQADEQLSTAESTLLSRLPETFQWLLIPHQADPKGELTWQTIKVTGQDGLAVRAAKRLIKEEALITVLGPTVLRRHMDQVPLWRGNHVNIRQLQEDFASYPYLPRLTSDDVLAHAIMQGLSLTTWQLESFAYADGYDEAAGRYQGLRCGQSMLIPTTDNGLLVKPDVAVEQLERERPKPATPYVPGGGNPGQPEPTGGEPGTPTPTPTDPPKKPIRRYHGSVDLDPQRIVRDAGKVAEEVVAHLLKLKGQNVRVTLEIEADFSESPSDQVIRIVTENGRTLRFNSQGFEAE